MKNDLSELCDSENALLELNKTNLCAITCNGIITCLQFRECLSIISDYDVWAKMMSWIRIYMETVCYLIYSPFFNESKNKRVS